MKLPIAVDLETTSVDAKKGSVLSCGVSDGETTHAWAVRGPGDLKAVQEVLQGDGGWERQASPTAEGDMQRVVSRTDPLDLGERGSTPPCPHPVIVHYVPMESSWSELFLGNLRHTNFRDTALMAYRVDPGEPMKLASVVARHLPEYSGWKGSTEEQLAAPETGRSMLNVSMKDVLERNAVDACLTKRLHDKLWAKLSQEEKDIHQEDVRISMFVDRMSRRGMYVSEDALVELRRTCVDVMEREASWLREAARDPELNPGSSQQLAKLFESNGVVLPKTKGGASSVNGLALRVLRNETTNPQIKELVDHVLAYRRAQDRLGDNVTAYAQARDPGDGRIRGGFFWPGTISWRPTCYAPNRLNVPREGVRHLFGAPPGWVVLEMDLSQAELRIMAQLSGDRVLVDGFQNRVDFHRRMGSRVYGKPEESVTKSERYVGKKTNFSCGYFIGDNALWESFAREDLILDFEVVRRARSAYWSEYTGLARYADDQRRRVRRGEPLFAPTGAYRWTLEQSMLVHPHDENEAVNSVYNWTIQSVPPRLVYRMGMLLEDRIPESCCQIVNSVYDCLVMYVHEDVVPDVVEEIERVRAEVMAAETWLKDVDIPADTKVGTSWGTLKEIEVKK